MNIVLNTADTAIAILPPESAAKFQRLVEKRRDLAAVMRLRQNDLEDAWRTRDERERNRAIRVAHFTSAGRRPNPDDISSFDAAVAEAERIVADRKRAADQAADVWRATDVVEEVRRWIDEASRSGVRLKYVPPVLPKATANAAVEVEKLRRRLDEIAAQFAAVENAPRPASAMREALKAELDRLASEPRVRLTERAGSPVDVERELKGVRDDAGRVHADAFGFLLWAIRPAIEERLLSILPNGDVPGALSDEERDTAMDKLTAERLAVEREEESVIVAAEASGLSIARRREASPLAVLEVAIVAGRIRD